jgi:hypothetical protein
MQIKTTMRYQLNPIGMAIFKKSKDNKGWQGKSYVCTPGKTVN